MMNWAATTPMAEPATFHGPTADQQRFAFLAEASRVLATSLDYETTLQSVARLAVPAIADYCLVDLLEEDGTIRGVAVAHVNPSKEELAHEMRRHYPPDPQGLHPVSRVLRTSQPELSSEVTDEDLAAIAHDVQHLRLARALAPRSTLVVPLLARDRTLGAITFAVSDSGRRYGEADLALAEDLARRAAVAVDNARLYHEAQNAVRARDEFLSSASHDLKNPLASIKGFAQLLQRRLHRPGDPDIQKLAEGLAHIDDAVTRMTALINELVDVTRVHMGQGVELDIERIDLVAMAERIAAAQQETTQQHCIRVEPLEPEIVGHWDHIRIERVLANLVSNAIKYSPNGGNVTIRISRSNSGHSQVSSALRHSHRPAQDWAVLAVQDQGVGIPADEIPRIFERFHRATNVTDKFDGTGIGLTSARQIVEQHGGTISVTSLEGVGTTFTVQLPLATPEP